MSVKVLPLAMLAVCWLCSCSAIQPPLKTQWRYGVYSEDNRNPAPRFIWETSGTGISCATRAAVVRELGYNVSDKAESSENNLTLLMLFDQLGAQGWQLVHIEECGGEKPRRYFFRQRVAE